jgi:hypothetical protein
MEHAMGFPSHAVGIRPNSRMESLSRPDSHVNLEGKAAASPYRKSRWGTPAAVVNFVTSLGGNGKEETGRHRPLECADRSVLQPILGKPLQ